MKRRSKSNLSLFRGLIYVFLVLLVIVTIIPIWLVLVNATRSTLEI